MYDFFTYGNCEKKKKKKTQINSNSAAVLLYTNRLQRKFLFKWKFLYNKTEKAVAALSSM